MSDKGEELIRRAAALKAESEQLVAVSERLANPLAEPRTGGTMERRPASAAAGTSPAPRPAPGLSAPGASGGPGIPGGEGAGDVAVARPGPGILDADEAVALAVLLEELAARSGPDPVSGRALRAAALLRRRVAAAGRRGIWPRPGAPAVRRETGDARDGAADDRDAQAVDRDARAVERDHRATERDRQSAAADGEAAARDQQVHDRLWAAEPRERVTAERAAVLPPAGSDAERQQWELDRELARADQARDQEDRELIGEILAQARTARQAALHDRYAAGRDRVAARRDRGAAQADRQDAASDRHAAQADRDQAVIESEEQPPPAN